jgi:hypothetical protein
VSTFSEIPITCPHCRHTRERSVAVSVNAERSPHLREAILDGSFQAISCESCRGEFVIGHPFLYVDFPRKQWFMCHRPGQESACAQLEQDAQRDFSVVAQNARDAGVGEIMEGIQVEVVFGLLELRERLLA